MSTISKRIETVRKKGTSKAKKIQKAILISMVRKAEEMGLYDDDLLKIGKK